ncbi:MAG TPA: hypothetical protein EYG03_12405 [Planctomycetes bacterium]|nr:hypothetical protein [Fuerstiella sp.]HIK92764.1 hypothetical protein [Planctomycetota bacterium]
MESSRGGPLTTFIMMLPLIVVPAIAMLRPSNPEGGFLSSLLSAGSGDSAESESSGDEPDFDGFSESDFEAEFAEILDSDDEDSGAEAPLFSEEPSFPSESDRPNSPSVVTPQAFTQTPPSANSAAETGVEALTAQVRTLGATRTLWFSPGDTSTYGFVAFFPAGQGIVRYRFEAIATSKAAAVRDVIHQASEWKSSQSP